MIRIPILRHPVPGSPAEELLRRMLSTDERGSCRPAIAVSDAGESFHVRVALPGVDARSVRLAAVENTLVLQAECPRHSPGVVHVDELQGLLLYRKIELPEAITPDQVTAVLDRGMLEITAAKVAAERRAVTAAAVF